MDNFDLAQIAVRKASKILHIKEPEVVFFKTEGNDDLNIRSVFFKEIYQIGFDSEALEVAPLFQIVAAAYHESRHAFQWLVINGLYTGRELIEQETIDVWRSEFCNYTSPSLDDYKEKEYLLQEIEVDAILFAYNQWEDVIDEDVLIPAKIRSEITHRFLST